MSEEEILVLIATDIQRMAILRAVAALGLKDWWIGAGFVRNKVWETLFGNKVPTKLNDVDVVYWKPLSEYGLSEEVLITKIQNEEPNPVWDEENVLTEQLIRELPEYIFEVKNQARMHLWSKSGHERKPYLSAADAIADWVETATTVGVKLDDSGALVLLASHGIDDLVNGIVRPTNPELLARAHERATTKGWFTLWPKLRFEES